MSTRPGQVTYFDCPASLDVRIADQERSCVIDAVRIDANVSDEMCGDRRNCSVLAHANSIADRAAALESAALLQRSKVRVPRGGIVCHGIVMEAAMTISE